VPEVVRLCAMNLYLHGIADRESPVEARDALLGDGGKTYDLVLTNPPFGKKAEFTESSATTARSKPKGRITTGRISSSRRQTSSSIFCSTS